MFTGFFELCLFYIHFTPQPNYLTYECCYRFFEVNCDVITVAGSFVLVLFSACLSGVNPFLASHPTAGGYSITQPFICSFQNRFNSVKPV